MALVSGSNFLKMYEQEPKELGEAGTQHVKLRVLSDEVTGLDGDDYKIGELPNEARLLEAFVLDAAAAGAVLEVKYIDDAGALQPLALGESVPARRPLVVNVAGADLTAKYLGIKYVQC